MFPHDPYTTKTCWCKRSLTAEPIGPNTTLYVYDASYYYLSDNDHDGMSGTAHVTASYYSDSPDMIYIDIDNIVSMTVYMNRDLAANTIAVTKVVGEHWLTGHAINLDSVMFNASLVRKGKPTIYETPLHLDILEAIQGVFGGSVSVTFSSKYQHPHPHPFWDTVKATPNTIITSSKIWDSELRNPLQVNTA